MQAPCSSAVRRIIASVLHVILILFGKRNIPTSILAHFAIPYQTDRVSVRGHTVISCLWAEEWQKEEDPKCIKFGNRLASMQAGFLDTRALYRP